MILCGKCGTQNDLGRVFCVQCGTKLELSAMTSEAVAEKMRISFFAKHWPKFVVGLVVIALAVFGLTFWPSPGVSIEAGTPVGARRIESQLKGMSSLGRGRALAYMVKEADINAFFQYGKGKDLNAGSVSVKCSDGFIQIHVKDTMFKLKLGGFVWEPGVTYDMYCIGVGGNIIVRKVTKGHLPLLGPAKTAAVRSFYSKLNSGNLFDSFKYVSDIQIEQGQVKVTVSNK